jgi:hypothetical protein
MSQVLPVIASPAALAKSTAGRTPRLAAALMKAENTEQPVSVLQYGQDAIQSLFSDNGMVSKWGTRIALGAMAPGAALALMPIATPMAPFAGAVALGGMASTQLGSKFNLRSIYDSVLGTISKLAPGMRDQELATATPQDDSADPHFRQKREQQLLLITASIVGSGFGNPGVRIKDGGAFDMTVLKQVRLAADKIAPNRLLSSVPTGELLAISTFAMQASAPTYAQEMHKQSGKHGHPLNGRIVESTKDIPDAATLASGYMKNGVFDQGAFQTMLDAPIVPVDEHNTSKRLREGLLQGMASKAKDVIALALPAMGAMSLAQASDSVVEGVEAKIEQISRPAVNWIKKMTAEVQTSLQQRRELLESDREINAESIRMTQRVPS